MGSEQIEIYFSIITRNVPAPSNFNDLDIAAERIADIPDLSPADFPRFQ